MPSIKDQTTVDAIDDRENEMNMFDWAKWLIAADTVSRGIEYWERREDNGNQ